MTVAVDNAVSPRGTVPHDATAPTSGASDPVNIPTFGSGREQFCVARSLSGGRMTFVF
jgi:hypothetical protein